MNLAATPNLHFQVQGFKAEPVNALGRQRLTITVELQASNQDGAEVYVSPSHFVLHNRYGHVFLPHPGIWKGAKIGSGGSARFTLRFVVYPDEGPFTLYWRSNALGRVAQEWVWQPNGFRRETRVGESGLKASP